MKKLIKNEFIKLYKRPFIWMSIVIIFSCVLVYTAAVKSYKTDDKDEDAHWRENATYENQQYQKSSNDATLDEKSRQNATVLLKFNDFCLEYDIKPSDWRRPIVNDYIFATLGIGLASQTDIEKYEHIILDNDWKTYLDITDERIKDEAKHFPDSAYMKDISTFKIMVNGLRRDYDIKPDSHDWRSNLLDEVIQDKDTLLQSNLYLSNPEAELSDLELKNLSDKVEMNIYRAKNNIQDYDIKSQGYFVKSSGLIYYLILIIAIIITTIVFVGEFSHNTMIQLTSYPYKRYKIILAKLITIVISTQIMLVILYFTTTLIGIVAWGGNFNIQPHLSVTSSGIKETPFYLYLIIKYLYCFIEILIYILLTALLSMATKSTGVTIGITLPIALLSKQIIKFFSMTMNISSLKYIPFSSFDLNQFIENDLVAGGITMTFSITMIIFVTTLTSFFLFDNYNNKDI